MTDAFWLLLYLKKWPFFIFKFFLAHRPYLQNGMTCFPESASISLFFAKPFRDPEMKRRYTLLWEKEMHPPAAGMNGIAFLWGKLECQMSPGPAEGETENSQSAGSQDARWGVLGVCLRSAFSVVTFQSLKGSVHSTVFFIEGIFIPAFKPKGWYLHKASH